ncbi:MAG TPA: TIGR03000 domain-containing protein [Gemmataceae bacterium]|nr:TIGR03000 domain-containing protein [Gemmataceae bacterium]
MMYRSLFGVFAAVAVIAFGAVDASAQGVRFGPSYGFGYYGNNNMFWGPYTLPAYGWYYNPYVAPFPGYNILPPPFATYRMVYGYDVYESPYNSDLNNRRRDTVQLNYLPQKRDSLYPAVPFPRNETAVVGASPNANVFTFDVTVPTADATVLVGGTATKQTGLVRTFQTPALVADKRYTYTVEARWTDNTGKQQAQTTTFDFLLGEPTRHIVFPLPTK